MEAPLPVNEAERLATLRRYKILDTPPETSYDDLVHLASEICGMPIAAISLVDEDRQWFKSILGLEVSQTSRDVAFCAHAILDQSKPLIVEDATQDPRFADNSLVVEEPGIRFYAGSPLVMSNGHSIGTLCVIDTVPRTITAKQRKALEILAREVVTQMELRNNVHALERNVILLARTEDQLRRTQQQELDLKDEFVSHVSHELRSPLTPIYQFATILRDEIGGPLTVEQKEFVEIVIRNAEQLGNMIGDLLEVTRAQTGKLVVDKRRIRIEDVVADLVGSLEPTAGNSGVTLTSEIAVGLPDVIGDAARVRQILANLIENAMKFTEAGGSVSVHVGVRPEEPEAVRITVSDTGRGLSQGQCDRIFEQLYQVLEDGGQSRNGLGLGLYISRELVLRQGGRIWVDSEEGKGCHFSFTLPAFALDQLLMPLLTPQNLLRGAVAIVSADLFAGAQSLADEDAEQLMTAAWEAVRTSVHPAMDVLLPRFGNTEKGETFIVVAMADAGGAALIQRRIEERLSRCEHLQKAGYEVRINSTIVNLPESQDIGNQCGLAANIARRLEGQIIQLYEEEVVSDECEENIGCR